MNILLVISETAGRGKAPARAASIAAALHSTNHETCSFILRRDDPDALPHEVDRADLVIAVGGDGTLRTVAKLASKADTPIYHAPAGNENLFARQLGTTHHPDRVVASIDSFRTRTLDAATCNGELFTLMCSVGFDAGVLRRVQNARTKTVNNRMYARAIAAEFISHRPPLLSVAVDGETVFEKSRGLVVVANSSHYGGRFTPAPHADPADGRLDVVFLPYRSRLGLIHRMGACRFSSKSTRPNQHTWRGKVIRVEAHEPGVACQFDGEIHSESHASERTEAWDIEIMPGALRTLIPA